MSASQELPAKSRLVLVAAILGVLVGVLGGILAGERMLSAFQGNPRSGRGPTLFFLADVYLTWLFVKVIIEHFRKK